MKQNYDHIILGFGKGGKTLAAALAKKGERIALVEQSESMYGGTCINVGCIPSKSLVNSAEHAARYEQLPYEIRAGVYRKAVLEKRRVTGELREKNFRKLNQFENVTIYTGIGSFLSPNQINVRAEDGSETVLTGSRIYINTGSVPVIPPIPGIKDNPKVYTSETLMDEPVLPERLTLIGAGYIGMEFASMYANFGSQVTVLQDGTVFLPKEDRDVADEIRRILEKRGVRILTGAAVKRIEEGTVVYERAEEGEQRLDSDAILIAAGRRPNTESLQVQRAGIRLSPAGAVLTDDLLRTNVPGIWALGDVTGRQQFTYLSLDDYRIVLHQLESDASRTVQNRGSVPYSVFMDPPLSRVGLTEQEALKRRIPIRVCTLPAAAVPKAQVLGKTDGLLKAVVNRETDEIVGVSLLCAESYEMINLLKSAIDNGITAAQLRDSIYTHPTMTEALNDLFS